AAGRKIVDDDHLGTALEQHARQGRSDEAGAARDHAAPAAEPVDRRYLQFSQACSQSSRATWRTASMTRSTSASGSSGYIGRDNSVAASSSAIGKSPAW